MPAYLDLNLGVSCITGDAPPQFPLVKTLAIVAIIGWAVQPSLDVAFLFIQPELDPLYVANSEYALGRLGWLWQLGAVAVGVGALAMAAGFRLSLAPGKRVRLLVRSFAIAGLGVIGTGLFISGDPLHLVFGLLGIASLIISLFVARGVFARDPRWQPLARLTRWVAWLSVVGFVAMVAAPVPGLVQRIPAQLVWLIPVSLRMYRMGPAPVTPGQSELA